jgi:hypothetical protein
LLDTYPPVFQSESATLRGTVSTLRIKKKNFHFTDPSHFAPLENQQVVIIYQSINNDKVQYGYGTVPDEQESSPSTSQKMFEDIAQHSAEAIYLEKKLVCVQCLTGI